MIASSTNLYHSALIRKQAVPQLRRLVSVFPPKRPEFEPGARHLRSVADRAALGQVSTEYFGFPCHSIIPIIALKSSPSIIQGGYSRLINDLRNSRISSTPAPWMNDNKAHNFNVCLFYFRLAENYGK
jgi:hypothetical protein